jgi:hypothetical protein
MVKRLALVKDNMVQQVVLVEDNQVDAFEAPEGHEKILNEEVSVGDSYDGSNFHWPVPDQGSLIMHARRRYGDHGYIRHKVGDTVLVVDMLQRYTFDSLAERAKRDPSFTTRWVMWQFIPAVVVPLNAQQIIAFHDKMVDHDCHRQHAFAEIIDAIHDGRITTHVQVDNPHFVGVQRWPHRFYEDPTS